MNELRPVGAATRFAPVARNPGTPLTLDWFEDVQVNLSAAERRAASVPARRSVKKNYQAAWLVKALQCIDLTTLAAPFAMPALAAGPLTVEQFKGGQSNPTFMLTAADGQRYVMRRKAPGVLLQSAHAVDREFRVISALHGTEVPVARLPTQVLGYIYPSRYCQSDRLLKLANREFGQRWQGYQRVQGIRDWVLQHTVFTQNTSDSNTSAIDTLLSTVGVCRDFAHLMIALCRACNIPARFATGIDYGADPALGPQDFHAYVEAYVGHRWFLFDPSGTAIPMGFIRLATGRDAADGAFASIFGNVGMNAPVLNIEAIAGNDGIVRVPVHGVDALSTDDGMDHLLVKI